MGPFLASAPSPGLLSSWSQPGSASSGLLLPLTLTSAPLSPWEAHWGLDVIVQALDDIIEQVVPASLGHMLGA